MRPSIFSLACFVPHSMVHARPELSSSRSSRGSSLNLCLTSRTPSEKIDQYASNPAA